MKIWTHTLHTYHTYLRWPYLQRLYICVLPYVRQRPTMVRTASKIWTHMYVPYIRWLYPYSIYGKEDMETYIPYMNETTVYVQGQLYSSTTIAKTVCKAMKIWMHMYVPCIRQLFSAHTHGKDRMYSKDHTTYGQGHTVCTEWRYGHTYVSIPYIRLRFIQWLYYAHGKDHVYSNKDIDTYIYTIQHKTAILLSRKLAVFIVHTLSPLLIRLLLAFGLVWWLYINPLKNYKCKIQFMRWGIQQLQ